ARDLGGDIIPRIRQLRDRPQELPLPGKDLAPLALEDIRPVMPAGGDGEPGLRLDGIIHGRILQCGRGFAKSVRQLVVQFPSAAIRASSCWRWGPPSGISGRSFCQKLLAAALSPWASAMRPAQ